MPTDESVQEAIRRLVDEEHVLRANRAQRVDALATRGQRLQELEVELDQCWDLLRQRRALRAAGGDPEKATARPTGQVERYLQ
ncbi:DUF2630 family protein [Kribbella sancticallisti]|uniref:DUF2630 family protein n=1 Tax=Kribbella sancticallisti TaxID=460087 RepID=A0ABN2D6S0_9ACTN